MKYKLGIVILFFLIVSKAFAGGKVLESIEFKSKILSYPVRYSVYLPEDYDTSTRTYPVIYLLHGSSDNETSWIQFGEINRIMDEGIKSGEVSPAIIIMPDGQSTWYCNDIEKKNAWRDMFVNELIPALEKNYRIKSKKEFRSIVGVSMGGFGALSIALNYPDLFSTCAPLSSAFYSDDDIINMKDKGYETFQKFCGVGFTGTDRVSKKWKEVDPFDLLEKLPVEKASSIRYYIDCGDKDWLIKGNLFMHLKMKDLKIPHEFRVRAGSHGWVYWRSSMPEVLKYISVNSRR